jgi:hypothetical protein
MTGMSSTVRESQMNGSSHQPQARKPDSMKLGSTTENSNEMGGKEEINKESNGKSKTNNSVSSEETLTEKVEKVDEFCPSSASTHAHDLDTGTELETATSLTGVDEEVWKLKVENEEQNSEKVACSSEENHVTVSILGVKLEEVSNASSVHTKEMVTGQVEDVATGRTSSTLNLNDDQSPEIEISASCVEFDIISAKLDNLEHDSTKPDLEKVAYSFQEEASLAAGVEQDVTPTDSDMPLPPPPPPPDLSLPDSFWKEELPQSSIATPPSPDLPSPCSASNEDSQSSVAIPPPPLPPPIPETVSDPEFSVPVRHKLLASIREGVTLRQVPQEAKSRPLGPAVVKVVDVQSELRDKLRTRRKEEVQVMKSQIDPHQERIEQVKRWILESQHNQSSLQRLRMLLEEVKQVEMLVNVTPEVFIKQTSWPTELIDCIAVIVNFLNHFEKEVMKLEQLCATASAWREGASAGAAPVNPDAVWTIVKGIILNVKSIQDSGSRYAQAALLFTVSSSDVGDLIRRAKEATMSLLDIMFPRALQAVDAIYEAGLTKYDQTFRVGNSHRLLTVCCQLNDSAITYLSGTKHPLYSDAQLRIKDLEDIHSQALSVPQQVGERAVPEQQVILRSSSETPPRTLASKRMSTGTLKNLVQLVRSANTEHVLEALRRLDDPESFQQAERELLTAAVASGNCQVIDIIMQYRQSISMEQMSTSRQFDVIHEAIVKGKLECLSHLVLQHGFAVNCRSTEAGNSPLLIAARHPDYASIICLIRLGADLFTVNQAGRNVLQLLALKGFSQVNCSTLPDTPTGTHLDLSSYINNPSLRYVM